MTRLLLRGCALVLAVAAAVLVGLLTTVGVAHVGRVNSAAISTYDTTASVYVDGYRSCKRAVDR